jgi:hypothetical protein
VFTPLRGLPGAVEVQSLHPLQVLPPQGRRAGGEVDLSALHQTGAVAGGDRLVRSVFTAGAGKEAAADL